MSETEHASTLIQSQLKQDRSSKDIFELPCGYYDDTTKTLHREVVLREMDGEAEEFLANTQVPFEQRLDEVFGACVERIGDIQDRIALGQVFNRLTVGDRTFILIALRRRSLGDMMPTREQCPNPRCRAIHIYDWDLSRIEALPMLEPDKRLYSFTTSDGREIKWTPLTSVRERMRERYEDDLKGRSIAIMLRLVQVDGLPPEPEDVKRLKLRDRDALSAEFVKYEGGVDTTFEITCRSCRTKWSDTLTVAHDGFFSPSETRAFWQKRSGT